MREGRRGGRGKRGREKSNRKSILERGGDIDWRLNRER